MKDALHALQTLTECNYSTKKLVMSTERVPVSYTPSFLLKAKPAAPRSLFIHESKTGVKTCVCDKSPVMTEEVTRVSWLVALYRVLIE